MTNTPLLVTINWGSDSDRETKQRSSRRPGGSELLFNMSGFPPEKPGHDLEPSSSRSAKALGKAVSRFDLDGHDLPPSPAPSSPRNGKRYALATELVSTEGTDQYNASSVPIYQVGSCGFLRFGGGPRN